MTKKNIVSPVGDLRYAFLTKSRENLSGVHQFSVVLRLSEAEAKPLINEIMAVWKESGIKKEMKSAGYRTDDETGMIDFNFKTNSTFADGSSNSVAIFDSKGKKVDLGDTLVGNGSKGRVKAVAASYEAGANAGITLYLNSVQITKLIEYEGGESFDAIDGDGFEISELDDPFTADEVAPKVPNF